MEPATLTAGAISLGEAASLIATLIFSKALEKGGEKLGEVVSEKIGQLLKVIREKFQKEGVYGKLIKAEEEPSEKNKNRFERELAEQMEDDEEFAARITQLMEDLIKQKLKQEILKQCSIDSSLLSEEILEKVFQQAKQELFKDVRVGRDLIIKGDIIQKVIQSRNIQIQDSSSEIQDLFFEDFEGNVDIWKSTGDCNNCTFTQGLLRVDKTPAEIRVPNSIFYEKFLFEVKVTSLQAGINWKVALRFWTRQEEMYFYIICRRYNALSFFQLSKKGTDDDLVDLIPPTEIAESRFKPFDSGFHMSVPISSVTESDSTKNSVFHPIENRYEILNSMKLIAEGSNLELYFNDILLDRFRMSYNIEGMLAFLALYGSQIVFDDVRVARLRR